MPMHIISSVWMVTGNFALLTGETRSRSEWYLAVYADAYAWVELPEHAGHGDAMPMKA